MIGILGSGFGLYGYLPAVASLDLGPILLPVRYKEKLSNRSELAEYFNRITWINTDNDLLDSVKILIIAKRPIDQYHFLDSALRKSNLTNIIFEKPFAKSPEQAFEMQEKVLGSKIRCSVNYIFRYLYWAKLLESLILNQETSNEKTMQMKWHFFAHHYQKNTNSWKCRHSEGGGVIRFYGIHIIALLAEFGYENVLNSKISNLSTEGYFSRWNATFIGKGLPNFKVEVDSKANNTFFTIANNGYSETFYYENKNPFSSKEQSVFRSEIDIRSQYIRNVLLDNYIQPDIWPNRYIQAIKLWKEVEIQTNLL